MQIGDLVTWIVKPQGNLYLDNEIGIVIGNYHDSTLALVKVVWLNGRYSYKDSIIMDTSQLKVIEQKRT